MRGGGPQGGVEGQVGRFALGDDGPRVAAGRGAADRGGAAPAGGTGAAVGGLDRQRAHRKGGADLKMLIAGGGIAGCIGGMIAVFVVFVGGVSLGRWVGFVVVRLAGRCAAAVRRFAVLGAVSEIVNH